MAEEKFNTFEEFYPFYLNEHRNTGTRVTHFIGTTLFFAWIITAIITMQPLFLLAGVITAYGFAWVGHFFIEKNKPATFKYPGMSLRGDFKMYFDIWTGKQGFKSKR